MAAKNSGKRSQCGLLNLSTTYRCELKSSHEASALPKANRSMLSFVRKNLGCIMSIAHFTLLQVNWLILLQLSSKSSWVPSNFLVKVVGLLGLDNLCSTRFF